MPTSTNSPDDQLAPPMTLDESTLPGYGDASLESVPSPMRPRTGSASGPSPFDTERPATSTADEGFGVMRRPSPEEPSPQGPPPSGKQQFHDTMADFGHAAEKNRAAVIGLDPGDPDYTKKLAALQEQHGAITQEKARYQMLHPWGGPESAHPGVLGKIGHVASEIGQVAGSALVPNLMKDIPGSQDNLRAKGAGGAAEEEAAVGNQQKAAQTGEEEAKTGLEKEQAKVAANPKPDKPETPQQVLAGITAEDLDKGVDPAKDPRVGQVEDTITGTQRQPVDKAPHVTYDSGIPVSVTSGDKTYDVNDPKLPPELKPLVDSAQRAHGQHTKEDSDKQAVSFAQQEKMFNEHQAAPTNSTKTMLEAAPRVIGFIDRVGPLIDKLEKSGELGPGAGRWSEFWAGKVGTSAPEYTKLRTDIGLLSTLLMRMHVGARGGEYIMKHFSDLIDQGKQSPDNMRAALGEIREYAQQLNAERSGKPAAGGVEAPKQSFADWKKAQAPAAGGP